MTETKTPRPMEARPLLLAGTMQHEPFSMRSHAGFRVNVAGTKFMLKTDDDVPERATAATAIASRLYDAAGWWAPCDSVVYFKRSALRLEPGLTIKANVGPPKIFDQSLLGSILAKTARRGDRYRAAASRWLPGRTLGPFTYEGQRADDPSDVIPHENRRDLRGARVMAAWLNHFDSRGGSICLTDLARKTSTYPADRFRYEATVARGGNDPLRPAVDLRAEGELCLSVRGVGPSPSQGAADDAIERYVIVRIKNGATPGPIVLHLYDLGTPRGLRLVGVERPD